MNSFPITFACLLILTCEGSAEQRNTLECSFFSNDVDPDLAELQPRGLCAYELNGRIFVSHSALHKLSVPAQGLASINVEGHGWYFVRPDGSTIASIPWENGPDDFVEGLARYTEGGKVGFIDTMGNIAIKAQYQHASQFSNGHAVVCNGCTNVSDGEHTFLKGGSWGCIDKNSSIVFPVEYSETEIHKKLDQLNRKDSGQQSHGADGGNADR